MGRTFKDSKGRGNDKFRPTKKQRRELARLKELEDGPKKLDRFVKIKADFERVGKLRIEGEE